MRCGTSPVKLLLAFLFASMPLPGSAAGRPEGPYRVLIIHSFGRDYAPFSFVVSQFRADLAARGPRPVEFVEASLEMARFDGEERDKPLLDFLRSIYQERPPDLVVPIGAPAALFRHRHRAELFSSVPSMVVGIDRRRWEDIGGGVADAAVSVELNLPQLMQDALTLLPDTREVFVVIGSAPLEKFWEQELRREWTPVAPGVRFHWLSDRSMAEICEIVAHPPPYSIIFQTIMNRDAAGIPHEGESALVAVREAARAPIFGYGMEQLGQGTVGGRLLSFKSSGTQAAEAALGILAGNRAITVFPEPVKPANPTFDWRELQRWRIPESRLPAGSTVLFREPGLWQAHRTTVLVALAILAAQTFLILKLLAARRQARDGHASISLAADSAGVGFWRRDPQSDIIHASTKWREIFGLPASGPLQISDVLARIHPEDEPRVHQVIDQAARAGSRYELEHRIVRPDGSVRWIASMGRADSGHGGSPLSTRGISVDITERKAMESEVAQQRSEMAHLSRVSTLGELSGSLAHELNQPLGSILTNAQAARRMVERSSPDLAMLREILDDIISEDRRAGSVITRLKALLKHGETIRQPVDLAECIGEVLSLLRSDLSARGVQVECDSGQPLPRVFADRVQLQQVLLNLITNACDAMEGTPADLRMISLRASDEGGQLHLEVRDRGSGIDGDPDVLFKPFHTTKQKGLGLGLAICRTIIASHDGRLWATPNPAGGAIFHVTLPAAPSSPPHEQ